MDAYCKDIITSRLLDNKRDIRYSLDAYDFVFLVFNSLEKNDNGKDDFSAKEITSTAVETANVRYGSIAQHVLASMGIKTARDIGAIVSNLVDLKLFFKNDFDKYSDFEEFPLKPLFTKINLKPIDIENLKIFEDT